MADNIDLSEFSSNELPFSLDAEQSVIGAMLIDPDALTTAMNYLKSESFYISMHRDLYSIITRNFAMGVRSDAVTVLDEAVKEGIFENAAAGKEYLVEISRGIPSTANIESYCKIVAEKFYLRSLITASKEIMDMCRNGEESAEMMLDYAEQKIFDIRQGRDADGLRKIEDVVVEAYDDISKKSGEDREKYLGMG